MLKRFLQICSIFLAVVLLINMLPLQVFAEDFVANLETEDMTGSAVGETVAGQIVDEITDKRTEYTKQFRMDNGLYLAAVYNEPVHYEKDGQWEEIDNTLTLRTDGTYGNTAGVWDVRFPDALCGSNQISVTKDGYTLSFSMAGELRNSGNLEVMSAVSPAALIEDGTAETFAVTQAQAAPAQLQTLDLEEIKAEAEHPETVLQKNSAGILYANVYGTTDIRYDLNANRVKESVILESYSAGLRGYRYSLNVGQLVPVLGEDGHVDFYDPQKTRIIMSMAAPFLVDAAMEYSYDVQVRLTGSGSNYTLTYLLPTAWLAEADRAWPVVLDPVVEAELSTSNISDVTVATSGSQGYQWGMNSCGYNAETGLQRFYLKYDELPSLTSADVVIKAEIQLYKPYDSSVEVPVQVHKVLNTWESHTMTWENKPDFDTTVEDYAICVETNYYTWDVTDIARGWYEGENTGMLFRLGDADEASTTENFKEFLSSDYSDTSDCLPALSIQFLNNNGIEGYWDYTSASAGRAGTGHVNNYTGNLVWVRDDIGFDGNLMPVSVAHVYNANDSAQNNFGTGLGWRTNYNQKVYQWTENDGYYIWEDEDGTAHYFEYDAEENAYYDEDLLGLELTIDSTSEEMYRITDSGSNTSYFDTLGRLVRQENNQQTKSSIRISYTSTDSTLISSITDGAGRVYNFVYTDGLLSRINYLGSGSTILSYVSYAYDNSKLTTITDKDGKVSTYTYADNTADTSKNLLASAQDIDGYKLTYTFNTTAAKKPARVSHIAETYGSSTGGALDFEYAHNQTTITDANGNVQIMQFNNMGNTICIQDSEGRAQYAQYAKNDANETGKGNQLTLVSKLQNTVGNMLKDSSFESSTLWNPEASGVAATYSITSTAYHGSKALYLSAEDATDLLGSSFAAVAGQTYTFSAYIKTDSGTASLGIRNAADSSDTETSETLTGSNGWTRLQVSYTNDTLENITVVPVLHADAGTVAYMDCVQVEKAPTASRYNLVENGDFRYSNYAWSSSAGLTTSTAAASQLENTVYQITGSPTQEQRISQIVNISGEEGDTFVLAGWGKGDSAPFSEYDENPRQFGLIATFNYTSGETGENIIEFNPDTNSTENWQYVAAQLVAEETYNSITVEIAYDYNVNTACFDGIQLYQEEFGESYGYDAAGNVTSVEDLEGQITNYEYTDNNLTKEILPSGAELGYSYDDYGNVLTATTETGVVYSFTYDTYGNNTSVSILNGDDRTITSTAAYSTDGNRLVSTTDALGKATTYSYNADTNILEWVQYPKDTADTRTNYTYDTMYRMASAAVTTNTGLSLRVGYTYANDNLASIGTRSGTVYTFSYGNFGLLKSVKIDTRTLASYTYTNDGNNYLEQLAYGNGDSVNYTYDQRGRVTSETYEDGDTVSYQYDNNGALATRVDSVTGIKTTYYYDFTDRLMKYVETGDSYSHSVGYGYDDINNLTSLVETINGVEHTTSYAYDLDNRITAVISGDASQNYTYDAYGRVEKQEAKYGENTILTDTYTFKNPTGTTTSNQIGTHQIESTGYNATFTYTYDDNGNITRIVNGSTVRSYVYDSANQLIRENNTDAGKTFAWAYDKGGNIISRSEYAYTTGNLGTPTKTITYTYGGSDAWRDLLIEYNGNAITYDENGNMTSNGSVTYTWEHGRQLTGTMGWTFEYNADGLRTKRTANGGRTYKYVYNDGKLTQMTQGSQTLYFTYDADGTPLTVTAGTTTFYYVTNIQGDVIGIVSSTGAKMASYTYDAWGNILTQTGSIISELNPLRYRGYVYDVETKLYYLQSRYYDPQMGRFINADDPALLGASGQILGHNLFTYCDNNPVTSVDPTGTVRVSIKRTGINAYFFKCTLSDEDIRKIKLGRDIITSWVTMALGTIAAVGGIPSMGISVAAAGIAAAVYAGVQGLISAVINYYDHGKGASISFSFGMGRIYGYIPQYRRRWTALGWRYKIVGYARRVIGYYPYLRSLPRLQWHK